MIAVFRYLQTEPVLQGLAQLGLLDNKEWYQRADKTLPLVDQLGGITPEEIVGDCSTPTLVTAAGEMVTSVMMSDESAAIIPEVTRDALQLLCDWRSDEVDADDNQLPWPEDTIASVDEAGQAVTWTQGATRII